MTSKYQKFDRSRLKLKPIKQRESKSGMEIMIDPDSKAPEIDKSDLRGIDEIASIMCNNRQAKRTTILAYGAHVFKNGCSPILIELMKRGYIQHLLTNGAGTIHDFEMTYMGRTEEDVRKYLAQGQFGLWDETGLLMNVAIQKGVEMDKGLGESLGQFIAGNKFPGKQYSLLGNAFELGIPLTSHIGVGYDIIHEHPKADGAVLGKASYNDFLIFANSVSKLNNGAFLSVGSAIMAPMVFEKALSMARNVAKQEGKTIDNIVIAVNDIQPDTWNWALGEPPKDNPAYYSRFCKTFARTTNPKNLRYVSMDNRAFLHNLYKRIEARERGEK
ncbi:MAG: hypothetical protein MUF61_00955 [archaeon]|nr:hypothetical protein [archaeon]